MNSLLAITVVTYNRPDMIEWYLGIFVKKAEELGIDIYIYDGSEDELTKKVTESYINAGYTFISYEHGEKKEGYRLFQGLTVKGYKYILMTGDKMALNPNNFEIIYREIISRDRVFDIIVHYPNVVGGIRYYDRCEELYRDFGWWISGYGYFFVRGDLFEWMNIDFFMQISNIEDISGFGIYFIIWNILAKQSKFNAVAIPNDPFLQAKSCPIADHMKNHELTEKVWYNAWVSVNKKLPIIYQPYVAEVIKDWGRPGFWTYDGILMQRISGTLTYSRYFNNKKNIEELTDVNSGVILIISVMPKIVIKLFIRVRGFLKYLGGAK